MSFCVDSELFEWYAGEFIDQLSNCEFMLFYFWRVCEYL
jgi:hypothetical protein